MPTKNVLINVRIPSELRDEAARVLAEFGLTVSDATRILLTRIVKDGGLPPYLTSNKEEYDRWFKEKVQEAIQDTRPRIQHAEAMKRLREKLSGSQNISRS